MPIRSLSPFLGDRISVQEGIVFLIQGHEDLKLPVLSLA
jgi:hypothetical protein